MAEIRINIAQVRRQAQQLDTAAAQLQRELRQLSSAKQSIPAYWDGTTARAFVQKLNEQYTALDQLRREMESVADDIRRVAERIQRQDEALQRAAQKL